MSFSTLCTNEISREIASQKLREEADFQGEIVVSAPIEWKDTSGKFIGYFAHAASFEYLRREMEAFTARKRSRCADAHFGREPGRQKDGAR